MHELTHRQEVAINVGWEVMKHQHVPRLFLWLGDDGWLGGNELNAEMHSPGQVAVRIKPWETLVLQPPLTTLN